MDQQIFRAWPNQRTMLVSEESIPWAMFLYNSMDVKFVGLKRRLYKWGFTGKKAPKLILFQFDEYKPQTYIICKPHYGCTIYPTIFCTRRGSLIFMRKQCTATRMERISGPTACTYGSEQWGPRCWWVDRLRPEVFPTGSLLHILEKNHCRVINSVGAASNFKSHSFM